MTRLFKRSHICLVAACFLLAGCHSAFVDARVVNHSGAAVRLVEMDYPNASFGTSDLPNGSTFKYRFKILGSGPTKLSWTDAHEKEESSSGPPLHPGQEGSLSVTLQPDGTADWNTGLNQ